MDILGKRPYLFLAVDRAETTVDFPVSARRDIAIAKSFC
ncbi:DDE-type integrase/transposase/recombinase [Paraburkholderia sp. 1N]|uniref:DDE-type integrase/transposase/recombinase n=1 Tax=Paraburkholderia solitsugae TaxID=2675748 RepID=A0ABX2BIC7_9BURK|nr:DDE-type integrase/transposase/recombinase [Paraburkholderia solitsugae]